MKFNVLAVVCEVVDARDEQDAIDYVNGQLEACGFNPYEGAHDLLPDGYKLAFKSDDQQ